LDAAVEKIAGLEVQLDRIRAEQAPLEERVAGYEVLQASLTASQLALEEAKKAAAASKGAADRSAEVNAVLSQDMDELRVTHAEQTASITKDHERTMEALKASHTAALADLNSKLETQTEAALAVTQRATEAEKALEITTTALASKQAEMESVKLESARVKEQLEENTSATRLLEQQQEEAEATSEKTTTELEEIRGQLAAAEAKAVEQDDLNSKLRERVINLKTVYGAMKEAYDVEGQAVEDLGDKHKEKILALREVYGQKIEDQKGKPAGILAIHQYNQAVKTYWQGQAQVKEAALEQSKAKNEVLQTRLVELGDSHKILLHTNDVLNAELYEINEKLVRRLNELTIANRDKEAAVNAKEGIFQTVLANNQENINRNAALQRELQAVNNARVDAARQLGQTREELTVIKKANAALIQRLEGLATSELEGMVKGEEVSPELQALRAENAKLSRRHEKVLLEVAGLQGKRDEVYATLHPEPPETEIERLRLSNKQMRVDIKEMEGTVGELQEEQAPEARTAGTERRQITEGQLTVADLVRANEASFILIAKALENAIPKDLNPQDFFNAMLTEQLGKNPTQNKIMLGAYELKTALTPGTDLPPGMKTIREGRGGRYDSITALLVLHDYCKQNDIAIDTQLTEYQQFKEGAMANLSAEEGILFEAILNAKEGQLLDCFKGGKFKAPSGRGVEAGVAAEAAAIGKAILTVEERAEPQQAPGKPKGKGNGPQGGAPSL